MMEGIRAKKRIKVAYKQYEGKFDFSEIDFSLKFDKVIQKTSEIFPNTMKGSEFSRPFLFYTLYTAVYHCMYGLRGLTSVRRVPLDTSKQVEFAKNGLDRVEELFAYTPAEAEASTTPEERKFLSDSRRATTDQIAREGRTRFILSLLG